MKEFFALVRDIFKDQFELYKLKLVKLLTDHASAVVLVIISSLVLTFFMIFLSIAGALLMNKLMNSQVAGFGIVTGLYFLVLVLLFFGRSTIKKLLQSTMIRQILKKDE